MIGKSPQGVGGFFGFLLPGYRVISCLIMCAALRAPGLLERTAQVQYICTTSAPVAFTYLVRLDRNLVLVP